MIELTSSGALVNNDNPVGANFHSPEGIAIDDDGNVWITDQSSGQDSNGALDWIIGAAGAVLTPQVACLTQATAVVIS